jgi:hypothetical protein
MQQELNTDAQRQQRLKAVLSEEAAITVACQVAGFELRTSTATTGHSAVPHWHWHVGRDAVFHWWPSNGKWWNCLTGMRGVELDPWRAYRLALLVADERIRELRGMARL